MNNFMFSLGKSYNKKLLVIYAMLDILGKSGTDIFRKREKRKIVTESGLELGFPEYGTTCLCSVVIVFLGECVYPLASARLSMARFKFTMFYLFSLVATISLQN